MVEMRILHVIAGLERAAGTTVFCVRLCEQLAAAGHYPAVFYCREGQSTISLPRNAGVLLGNGRIRRLPGLRAAFFTGVKGGLADLTERFSPEIVHVHALWDPVACAGARLARRRGLPLVYSIHGMATPWSLAHHAWKKKAAWLLYQRANLRAAALLHATAGAEADDLRGLGFRQPIAVVPLGVDLPESSRWEREPSHDGKRERMILFVSRIHPKKGLLNLVEAWARVRQPGWRVVVAGPDEGGHLREVKRATEVAGMAADFQFPGAVYGNELASLYAVADLFVLPSYSENFGAVVPEALSYGVPVITTRATPWEELRTAGCGWWIAAGVDPLAAALREAMSATDCERQAMGQSGRELVRIRYSWPAVTAMMVRAYQQTLSS